MELIEITLEIDDALIGNLRSALAIKKIVGLLKLGIAVHKDNDIISLTFVHRKPSEEENLNMS